MDTSKEYIKMCDCPEIQEPPHFWVKDGLLRSRQAKSFGLIFKDDEPIGQVNENEYYIINGDEKFIWLPRQDQLQEMAKGATPVAKLLFFYDFIDEIINGYTRGRIYEEQTEVIEKYSLEQLWLMFVMQEKFSALWTGSEWYRAHWTEEELKEIQKL